MNIVDLHTHSNKSDGSFTPRELVDYAVEKGLTAFALTDHDTTEGLEEAITYAAEKPIEVIPGIELSTEYQGRDIHIVGIDIDYHSPAFLSHLKSFQDSRVNRNIKMCNNLREAGIDITFDKLQAEFPGSVITRSHYAKYLLSHGYIKNLREAFERYVGDHCKYFVPREKITPAQAVSLILEAGGIPILAHPVLYHMTKTQLETLVRELKAAGLVGIEAVYSTYSSADEREIKALAAKFGLCISGGSDFHGTAKPGLDLASGYGRLMIPEEILTNLRMFQHRTPKIFFTDLDGTLLTTEKKISPKTRQELHRFMAKGNYLAISSGRPLKSILEIIQLNDLDYDNQYAIAFNGALIYHCPSRTKLLEQTLTIEQAHKIARISLDLGIFCQTYDDEHILIPHEGPEINRYTRTVHVSYQVLPHFPEGITQPPCKMLCVSFDHHEKLTELASLLQQELPGEISCVLSNPNFLEVFPSTAGKGSAVTALCQMLDIPIENSYAAGDEENDLSMLETAGCGIAMRNGRESLKESADIVTEEDNDHDGLAMVIHRITS